MSMEEILSENVGKWPHHEQLELCTTRPLYRQGRRLTAVKVYSVVSESCHLLISGVPSISLENELRHTAAKFGHILDLKLVKREETEQFVDTFHLHYARIQTARYAKKQLDGLSFFGGVLHVCYAPELESLPDIQAKLKQRQHDVAIRLNGRLNSYGSKRNFKKRFISSKKPDTDSCESYIWNGQQISTTMNQLPSFGPQLPQANSPSNLVQKKTHQSPHVKLSSNSPATSLHHQIDCLDKSHTLPHTNLASSSPVHARSNYKSNKSLLKFLPHSLQFMHKLYSFRSEGHMPPSTSVPESLQSQPEPVPAKIRKTQECSMNSTILAVREKIRSISEPRLNVIVFKKQTN